MTARPFPALFPLLLSAGGCHLLADATIEKTCDELPGCRADTGSALPSSFGVGVAIVYDTADGGFGATLEPPALGERVRAAWLGDLVVVPAYDEATDTFALAGADATWVFSADGAWEVPGVGGQPVSAVAKQGRAWVATTTTIHRLDLDDGDVAEIEPGTGSWTNLRSLVVANGGVYALDLGGSADLPDLWFLGESGPGVVYEDFASDRARVSAGIARGPDDYIYACSSSGAIYATPELVAATAEGRDPVPAAEPSGTLSDVVGCGWDGSAGAWLLASASLGLLVLPDGASEAAPVFPDAYPDGFLLESAQVY